MKEPLENYPAQACQVLQKPAGATKNEGDFRSSFLYVSGLAENPNSIFRVESKGSEAANGCPVPRDAGIIAERRTCAIELHDPYRCALSRARPEALRFSLDN